MKKRTSRVIIHLATLFGIIAVITVYFSIRDSQALQGSDSREVKASVVSADNSEVSTSGFSNIGYQELTVDILEGSFKGQRVFARNNLIGQTDMENLFQPGDTIIVAVILKNGSIDTVKAVDLYRQDILLWLFVAFVVVLLVYAGVVGVKSLISFVLTVLIIWEFLVKNILTGHDPITTTILTLMMMSAVIIFLVSGINRRGWTAFLGTLSGLFITLLITLVVGDKIGLYGLTQPYVNALVFSGYYYLDIQRIFYAAIILGASGAAMDIAMDISASMEEIKRKKPDIEPIELVRSGLNVGRQVIGTMSTTLLLAYSGGYLTLLLIFSVKETSLTRMLNLKIVAAEIMRTLIGSIGLVLVAPITAAIGGLVITGIYKRIRVDWKANRIIVKRKES